MFNQGLRRVFYGWWIVLAAFLNLLFAVGIIFYGFPVFYPFLVESLGFTRAQLTQGFLLGFLVVGLLFALVAGVLIDRYGPRSVILVGVVFVGGSLVLMGRISKLWQYYALCISEVLGYTLAGPIPKGLRPDGAPDSDRVEGSIPETAPKEHGDQVARAVRTPNFWLIVGGCTLVIGAIGAVIQHFILFLRDEGYTPAMASRLSSGLLLSSLAGRVLVGYFADRYIKKNVMALFYLLLGLSIPLLFLAHQPSAAWSFAVAFGFSMGADYMLIPLVTAECFGLSALGRKNLRRLSQLPSRLVHNDSGSHSRCRGSLRHYTKTGDE